MATAANRSGGYNTEQFESKVDDMFKCSICTDVLKDPVELSCQHLYCKSCILQVLSQNAKCPQCRAEVTQKTSEDEEWIYYQPKRYFINMLLNLRLGCDLDGCQHISTIEAYANHQSSCPFGPNGRTQCHRCKAEMPRVKISNHDCVNYLLGRVNDYKTAFPELTDVLETQGQQIDTQAQEIERQVQEIERQAQEIERQAQEIQTLAQEIQTQAQEVERQAHEIQTPAQEIQPQAQEIQTQVQEIAKLKNHHGFRPTEVSSLQSQSAEVQFG